MAPSVSLVITVYNRERYLSDAIESILTQTYSDFELLIWDDGSTDNSIKIAQHYAAQDNRIRVIAGAHQGRAPALKAAMLEATAAYVGWVDSDDLLAQTALEETVLVLEQRPEVGLVYTNYLIIDENSTIIREGLHSQIPYSKERMLTDFITFHFRLMHRSIYEQVGGINEEFICCQDYDLCLRISEITEIFHLQKPLYYYRRHKESISGQKQIEQVNWSRRAVEQALQRRGMADKYELEVEIFTRCRLVHKQKTSLPACL
ncbi:glycosyltransferase [Phormidium tenue FACHB-886]|nr:glycosyltransferase [Phormidium tenue FACHB-886]